MPILAALLTATLAGSQAAQASDVWVALPAPALDNTKTSGPLQSTVLSGGCFWGTQGVFEHVQGVRQVQAGYAGGEKATADYESVSTGRTGHAESIQISFDPAIVTYGEILRIFFSVAHDPTEVNQQGPDEGTQYRSEIFYADASQQRIAQAYIAQLDQAHLLGRPIATRVDPLKGFYAAESYHQDYLYRNPHSLYIMVNDLPKITKLQRLFPQEYSDKPALLPNAR
ncbi:MAG TPA: peptide-methionine (S)-S-oxide reductase MsrA [Steroidobacteraceae bacterium]